MSIARKDGHAAEIERLKAEITAFRSTKKTYFEQGEYDELQLVDKKIRAHELAIKRLVEKMESPETDDSSTSTYDPEISRLEAEIEQFKIEKHKKFEEGDYAVLKVIDQKIKANEIAITRIQKKEAFMTGVLECVKNRDIDELSTMLDDVNHQVNEVDREHGYTPLMWAAKLGFDDVVHFLMTRHDMPAVDIEGKNKKTALNLAEEGGKTNIMEYLIREFRFAETKIIKYNRLSSIQTLDSGNFGNTFKAELDFPTKLQLFKIPVVCKVSKTLPGSDEFYELQVLQNVPPHPNLLGLIAICMNFLLHNSTSKKVATIVPYQQGGSIRNFVDNFKEPLSEQAILKYTQDIVQGIHHMHQHGYLHRDIGLRNCLFHVSKAEEGTHRLAEQRIVICDFGLSRPKDKQTVNADRSERIPWRWSAPETLESLESSISSDVWMIGISMWELLGVPCLAFKPQVIKGSQLLPFLQDHMEFVPLYFPQHCPVPFRDLITSCCKYNKEERITLPDLLEQLQQLIEQTAVAPSPTLETLKMGRSDTSKGFFASKNLLETPETLAFLRQISDHLYEGEHDENSESERAAEHRYVPYEELYEIEKELKESSRGQTTSQHPSSPPGPRVGGDEELGPLSPLQIEQKQQVNELEARKLETWRQELTIGMKVDVLDTVQKWYTADVIGVDKVEEIVEVHFDDWEPKWDEVISIYSYRLAEFASRASGGRNSGGMKDSAYNTDTAEFYLGQIVDVYSPAGQWLPGELVAIMRDGLRAHYLGFPETVDENIEIPSGRIAPKGRFMRPIKCERNHELEYTTKAPSRYTSGSFECNRCRRAGSFERGVFHCSKCNYDLCPMCRGDCNTRKPTRTETFWQCVMCASRNPMGHSFCTTCYCDQGEQPDLVQIPIDPAGASVEDHHIPEEIQEALKQMQQEVEQEQQRQVIPVPVETAVENHNVIEIDGQGDFNRILAESGDKLVVLDFHADWCPPCKRVSPLYHELSKEYEEVVFLKVDIDKAQHFTESHGVTAFPTYHFYVNQRRSEVLEGAYPDDLKKLIGKLNRKACSVAGHKKPTAQTEPTNQSVVVDDLPPLELPEVKENEDQPTSQSEILDALRNLELKNQNLVGEIETLELNRKKSEMQQITDQINSLKAKLTAISDVKAKISKWSYAVDKRDSICCIFNQDHQPQGTGFVIVPNVVMTSSFVIPSKMQASRFFVQFLRGTSCVGCPLKPERLFATSPHNARDFNSTSKLGYTVVGFDPVDLLSSNRLHDINPLRICDGDPPQPKEEVFMVHHPQGYLRKESDGLTKKIRGLFLRYQLFPETEKCSSGAPLFNKDDEIIALHINHGRVASGVLISHVLDDMKKQNVDIFTHTSEI